MLLTRNLGQRHRPQPFGERRRRRLRLGIEAVEKTHAALSRADARLSSRAHSRLSVACEWRIVRRSLKFRSCLMSSFGLSYAPSETLGFIPERLERLTTIMAPPALGEKGPSGP